MRTYEIVFYTLRVAFSKRGEMRRIVMVIVHAYITRMSRTRRKGHEKVGTWEKVRSARD
jgi:hypothetical protein